MLAGSITDYNATIIAPVVARLVAAARLSADSVEEVSLEAGSVNLHVAFKRFLSESSAGAVQAALLHVMPNASAASELLGVPMVDPDGEGGPAG